MKKFTTVAMSLVFAFGALAAPVLAQENSDSTSTTSTVMHGEQGRGNTKGMEQKKLNQAKQAAKKAENNAKKALREKNKTALTAANQAFRDAVKAANQTYEAALKVARDARKTALEKALADYKAAKDAIQPVSTSTPSTSTSTNQ